MTNTKKPESRPLLGKVFLNSQPLTQCTGFELVPAGNTGYHMLTLRFSLTTPLEVDQTKLNGTKELKFENYLLPRNMYMDVDYMDCSVEATRDKLEVSLLFRAKMKKNPIQIAETSIKLVGV